MTKRSCRGMTKRSCRGMTRGMSRDDEVCFRGMTKWGNSSGIAEKINEKLDSQRHNG
jgi:hypothetical protein